MAMKNDGQLGFLFICFCVRAIFSSVDEVDIRDLLGDIRCPGGYIWDPGNVPIPGACPTFLGAVGIVVRVSHICEWRVYRLDERSI